MLPIIVDAYGANVYGVIMSIIALTAFAGMAEMGLNGAIINLISRQKNKRTKIKTIKSIKNYFFRVIMVLVLISNGILLLLIKFDISIVASENVNTNLIFMITNSIVCINVYLNLNATYNFANEKGHINNFFYLLGSIISGVGLFYLVGKEAHILIVSVFLISGPFVGNLMIALNFYSRNNEKKIKRSKLYKNYIIEKSKTFLKVWIINTFNTQFDKLILIYYFGAIVMANISALDRIFAITFASQVIANAYWPYLNRISNKNNLIIRNVRIGIPVSLILVISLVILFKIYDDVYLREMELITSLIITYAIFKLIGMISEIMMPYLLMPENLNFYKRKLIELLIANICIKLLFLNFLNYEIITMYAINISTLLIFIVIPTWNKLNES